MFSKSLILGAFAAFAAAQSTSVTFTSVPDSITVGQSVPLKYTTNDASSPVTITLRKGDSNNLQTVSTLTTDSTGGSYEWTPESSLESGSNYALQITQGSESNYYGPFSITGGQNKASSSSASPESSDSGAASANTTSPTTMPPASGTGGSVSGNPMSHNATMSTSTLATATHTGVVYTSAASMTKSGATSTSSTVATGAASVNAGSAALSLLFGAAAVYFS